MLVEKLKMLCKEKGVSFSEFERESGVGINTASRWDTNAPSITKIRLAANYFGITVSELLGETENPATNEGDGEMDEMLQTLRERPDMRMLFNVTKKSTPEQVMNLATFLKGLEPHDDD